MRFPIKCYKLVILGLLWGLLLIFLSGDLSQAQDRRTLYWGTSGPDVILLQQKLSQWGYYDGPIDGIYGPKTFAAVQLFQRKNGLAVDGVVGPATWAALGVGPAPAPYRSTPAVSRSEEVNLLARVVHGEASGEPFEGKVAVAAVILNRVQSPSFPNTLAGVIYQPLAFESVANGQIWARPPSPESVRAAVAALSGWDPTYGALYFWNPAKPVNPWVWTRRIVRTIGRHVFAL
ncbi:spore cortex-lytic enzyme [Calderihabitans maritimus]|uniref:Spore cortex-lytic enzyme n=1 Tax=Calderihabitans maritimus TaxID=1246530 RepID=A0A1Z5HQP9_9FIRM|nr:spore cortex-lytic enzyme [Calderihabitans maritimus]GAW91635.1 Spore cortex-lytic enzyme SleB [Calderihabitans maritimus]